MSSTCSLRVLCSSTDGSPSVVLSCESQRSVAADIINVKHANTSCVEYFSMLGKEFKDSALSIECGWLRWRVYFLLLFALKQLLVCQVYSVG